MDLAENKIICPSHPVKYHELDYHNGYITITQHRTKRRVPDGYHFEDTGTHIYVSPFYSHLFQHKKKVRQFVLNKETKEWADYNPVTIEHHIPVKLDPTSINLNDTLTRPTKNK